MANSTIELELYLVRHGESMSNAGLTAGLCEELKNDPPLTDLGQRQAKLLGNYFSELPLDAIFSSGLRRSLNTAHEVALRQPKNGAKRVESHKIFTECNTGTGCIGRYIKDIQKDFPLVVSAEETNADERIIFHGEKDTDEILLSRAKDALAYIRNRFHNGEKVMLATHAAINTFILFAALGLGHEQIFDPSFYNTGITKIIFYKQGEGAFADVHLVYHNTVPHLTEEMPQFKF